MLLMSHFDKSVMNMGYYYYQESTDRHMDQESKYCGNERQLIVIRRHQADFCYSPPSQLKIFNFEAFR